MGFHGAQRLRDIIEGEHGDMDHARLPLSKYLGTRSFGGVAVDAGGPLLVRPVIPALVDGVHDVAVVAGRGVVAQVDGEVGGLQADAEHHSRAISPMSKGIFIRFHLRLYVLRLNLNDNLVGCIAAFQNTGSLNTGCM